MSDHTIQYKMFSRISFSVKIYSQNTSKHTFVAYFH